MSDYFYIESQLNQLVLTIDGFRRDGLLVMYPPYGGANQLWTKGPNETLVSKMGLVADVMYSHTEEGTNCIGYFPTGNPNQKWKYRNGQIVSLLSDLVIDITDGNENVSTPVRMWHDTGSLQQKWIYTAPD